MRSVKRKRSYIRRGLLVTLMGATALSGIYVPAFAQKGKVFAPATLWSVSALGGPQEGSAYCAMARKFSGNSILTFARNGADESSLAIDFQSPQFIPDRSISVTMDPGADEQRSFDITPLSNSALVVRLGPDSDFFDALIHTGLLRMEVGDQTYSFNLSDMDKGEFKLTACLKNLERTTLVADSQTEKEDGPELDPAHIQGQGDSDDSLLPLPDDDQQAEADTHVQPAPNPKIAKTETPAPDDSSADIPDARTDPMLDTLRAQLEALRTDLSSLKSENMRLAAQAQIPAAPVPAVSAQPGPPPPISPQPVSHSQPVAPAAPINAPVPLRAPQPVSAPALDPLEAAPIIALQAQMLPPPAPRVPEVNTKEIALEGQIKQLQEQITTTRSENEILRMQVVSLRQTQQEEAQDSVADFDAQIADKDSTIIDLSSEIASLESKLAEKARQDSLQAQHAENAELTRLSNALAERDRKIVELSRILIDYETLRTENAKMAAQIRQHEAEEQKIATLQVEINRLRALQATRPQDNQKNDQDAALMNQVSLLKQENLRLKNEVARFSEMERAQHFAFREPVAEPSPDSQPRQANTSQNSNGLAVRASATSGPSAPQTTNSAAAPPQPKAAAEAAAEPAAEPMEVIFTAQETAAQRLESQMRNSLGQTAPSTEAFKPAPVEPSTPLEPVDTLAPQEPLDPTLNDTAQSIPETLQEPATQDSTPAQPIPQQEPAQPEAEASPKNTNTASNFVFSSILEKVGVTEVQPVTGASVGAGRQAFSWQIGAVAGSGEQEHITSDSQFEDQVKSYLERTQSRCTGEFAIVPDRSLDAGQQRIDSYEIACVGGGIDSAASLLFIHHNQTFAVIAHEAPSAQLSEIMKIRDDIFEILAPKSHNAKPTR
jgi:hypothetical protein